MTPKYSAGSSHLADRIKKKVPTGPTKMGPKTALNANEEKVIVKWLIDANKRGFPKKLDDIYNAVQFLIKSKNRVNRFKNNRPSRAWYRKFIKRHPEIGKITKSNDSKKNIRKFNDYLDTENASAIILDRRRILMAIESNFTMSAESGDKIKPKRWKNIYQGQPINERDTISASGETASPFVVSPHGSLTEVDINVPNTRSDSGWVESQTFREFITDGLTKLVKDN